MTRTNCRIFVAIACFLVAPLLRAQVWVTVASESPTISVALPAGATYRLGNVNDGKWSASITISAATTINPTAFYDGQYSFPDPDPGVAKCLQVLEIAAAQVGTVTDSSVAQALVTTVNVPGTAPVAPPPAPAPASIPVPPGQVYIVSLSNISIVPGSADALVFNPTSGMVPLSQLIGTLLSGIQLNMTIDGITLNCSFGETFTSGSSSLICVVPATSSP
jgi:hypothetical protein